MSKWYNWQLLNSYLNSDFLIPDVGRVETLKNPTQNKNETTLHILLIKIELSKTTWIHAQIVLKYQNIDVKMNLIYNKTQCTLMLEK